MWSIPASEVDRIAAARPSDEVVDARDADDRRHAFAHADVLFATHFKNGEFDHARDVRWIHSSAVGVTGLLVPAVVDSPIVVSNSRGVHSAAIAEHAIALVLALRRSVHTSVQRQMARDWAQEEIAAVRVPSLEHTHVLVVGLGTIGLRVAALATALGMTVAAVRQRVDEPRPAYLSHVWPASELAHALETADVVVLAAPHTGAPLLEAAELARMKPTTMLVNVARGRLVDEPALIDALAHGRLAAAGLDAFAHEPLADDHPFWTMPNVLVTPHTAALSGDYWGPVVDLFLDNLGRFERGEALLNVVDKARGY